MNNPIEIVVVTFGQVLSLIIIVDSLLSFVIAPDHPVRDALGRILQPLYGPIRRILPSTGMFDFSPIVLLVLIQLVVRLFRSVL